MKQFFALGAALLTLTASAQQKEGKVIYERTVQMQVSFAGMNEEMQRMIPRSRTDKFELIFANNQTLYKQVEQEAEEDIHGGEEGGGIQFRMVSQGANDVIFTNLETAKRVEQRDLMDKKFIINDTLRKLKWKMTGESKMILNHPCMKAVATQISSRMQMTMDNGKMERKEVSDTSEIEAWFASDIPVSAGPSEFQGQLPGLILEMDIAKGRQVFKAIQIDQKADYAVIKAPVGKKEYTPEEYRKERDKMMDQMQQNRGSGQRVIRMN